MLGTPRNTLGHELEHAWKVVVASCSGFFKLSTFSRCLLLEDYSHNVIVDEHETRRTEED
jgi:hypothetical protein